MIYGIRFCDEEYNVGFEIKHKSHIWDDGTMTDDVLPGLCVIGIADEYDSETKELGLLSPVNGEWYFKINSDEVMTIAKSYHYPYKHAYIVGGDEICSGYDESEKIIENPVVISKLW